MSFPNRIFIFAMFVMAVTIFFGQAALAESTLEIRNLSNYEILNMRIKPVGEKKPFFMRLDLLPGAADKFVNPEISGTIRADTGLEMLFFPKIDLRKTRQLSFCQEHAGCLVVESKDGKLQHISAKIQALLPGPGSRPVCQLNQFRPRMPMNEVCALLDQDTPRDDNGAWLTGLAFANLLWAARLVPALAETSENSAELEHLELRRPLLQQECNQILGTLFQQGYAPWLAEFPGMDIDFPELPGKSGKARQELLLETIDNFFASHPIGVRTPQINNISDEEGEARIMLAPENSLPELANADEPLKDAQIITLILKPLSKTLLVDVAAYRGKKQ